MKPSSTSHRRGRDRQRLLAGDSLGGRSIRSESVLFRENEKFSLQNWLRHLWRDRGQTASLAEALLCGVVILVALFFGRFDGQRACCAMVSHRTLNSAHSIWFGAGSLPHHGYHADRSLRESLRIHLLHPLDLPIAAMTAVCLHPCYAFLSQLIQQEYASAPIPRRCWHSTMQSSPQLRFGLSSSVSRSFGDL